MHDIIIFRHYGFSLADSEHIDVLDEKKWLHSPDKGRDEGVRRERYPEKTQQIPKWFLIRIVTMFVTIWAAPPPTKEEIEECSEIVTTHLIEDVIPFKKGEKR